MMNEQEFINQMISFYTACNIPQDDIDTILSNNTAEISHYLAATPELMARKFYEWTFSKNL